jgi:hypothetical protein
VRCSDNGRSRLGDSALLIDASTNGRDCLTIAVRAQKNDAEAEDIERSWNDRVCGCVWVCVLLLVLTLARCCSSIPMAAKT